MRKYRTLNLGGEFEIDLFPIKSPTLKPELVTKDGKAIEKVKVREGTRAVNEYQVNGEQINAGQVFYRIGDKIVRKPRFTQFIKNYAEVPFKYDSDLVLSSVYYAHCPSLAKKLNGKKMLQFGFTWGNGFAFYTARIQPYADNLLLCLYYPNLTLSKTVALFSSQLGEGKEEIEDNLLVEDLIAESKKMVEVEG